MDTKERYGRFVLLNEDARTSAGSFFRAVQVGPGGYERHVQLFRSELLLPDLAQAVAEGLKTGLQIQHPQVTRGLEAGRLDKTAFAAYEMTEGRSVGALLERSQTEGHPFAADHALLIASKAAAALEAAQSKKQTHGFLVPEFVQVSHDGEVSVRGFGLSPRVLRDANCVGVREAIFLAPEVESAAPLDIRADIFSLGAQLFEMLTGAALPRTGPTSQSIDAARIHSPGHDGAPIPKALAALLLQALAEDPARRFKDAAAFKKAVDTLLFSGDYSPTTFNLAFFMHTLFRDEGDQDALQIKAERNADYRAHAAGAAAPAVAAPILPPPVPHAPAKPAETPRPEAAKPEPRAEPSRAPKAAPPTVPPVTATAAASSADDQLFRTVMAEKKSLPIVPIVVAVVALAAVGGYMMTRSGPAPAPPAAAPAMSAAETAALAKVKELESRLAAIEAEKQAAEQKATDEATRKIEAQAKARGKAVDPLELQRAQEEARKQAQAEQAALVQAEKQKIEDERRRADEARQAEAARVAAEAAKQAESTPAPPPPSTPAPTVAAAPSVAPPVQTAAPAPSAAAPAPAAAPSAPTGSTLLDLADPNVVAPVLVSQSKIEYPPMARAQRIIGVVVISALVDEQGNVAEARVIRGAPANSGLNEAALANVKKRKYKPGTLNGKPGRAWVAIQIDFKL